MDCYSFLYRAAFVTHALLPMTRVFVISDNYLVESFVICMGL